MNECTTLVIQSSELSIKRNKNIIKLHGSIKSNNSISGFDGDIHKQFVIAREDYDTYPTKHEAFTQLMRISLLQESYCLIGFSGDDTNFLEWIKWVRGVLERGRRGEEDYKIYLVSVDNKPIDTAKLLFYENHKVYPIPIMSEDLLHHMESETHSVPIERNNKKKAIELFLKYLSGNSTLNSAQVLFEVLQKNKYTSAWDSIKASIDNYNQNNIDRAAKIIENLTQYNRLPSIHFINTSAKLRLLDFQDSSKLSRNISESIERDQLISLILTSVKDTYLTLGVWEKNEQQRVKNYAKKSTKNKNEFLYLELRECALNKNKKSFSSLSKNIKNKQKDRFVYETLLLSAFSFNFEKLKAGLDSWNPAPTWVVKKAGLLSLFDNVEATEFLSDKLDDLQIQSQEKLYMLEVYRHCKQSIDFDYPKDLNLSIDEYKNLGLSSLSDNINYLVKKVTGNKEKYESYGKRRFNISDEISFSNDTNTTLKGLQFIQLLIETGRPLVISNVYWVSHQECYPFFKSILEYYPYPVLFFALQHSNSEFLKRLGQDFAYSDSEIIKSTIQEILITLLKAYLNENTPPGYKKSILYFTSELFIAVNPKYWQRYFNKIWQNKHFRDKANSGSWSAEFVFVKSCLPYIQDIEIVRFPESGPFKSRVSKP